MDEAEWLSSTDPHKILGWLESTRVARGNKHGKYNAISHKYDGGPTDRKLRLFACACARQVWHLMIDQRSRYAVEVAERFADGKTQEWVREAAHAEACHAAPRSAGWAAADMAYICTERNMQGVANIIRVADTEHANLHLEAIQVNLLRDIIGNPYHPVTFSPSWRTQATIAIAQECYDSRDFANMAVLADALEDAGCENGEVLRHCRGWEKCPCAMTGLGPAHGNEEMCGGRGWIRLRGPHCRGCWVVDGILSLT